MEIVILGHRIERQVSQSQDIGWCLGDDAFHIVHCRATTTLFPIPEANAQGSRVYTFMSPSAISR
jgi:pyruvate,water dikinase